MNDEEDVRQMATISAMVPGFGSAQEGGHHDVLRLGSFRAPGERRIVIVDS